MWLLLLFLIVLALLIAAAILQWLWNETMPDVFGLTVVTYWQALRLLLIAGIIIGGPGLIQFHFGT